ncbi:hypothetical protein H4V99_002916 [Cryobacterium sp. CG_9.6]|nr:hypothetical protein [Cryobacterium sp. CG_9.6]
MLVHDCHSLATCRVLPPVNRYAITGTLDEVRLHN